MQSDAYVHLMKLSPRLGEILQASPFDPNRSIDGAITEPLFFEKMFVKSKEYDELAASLEAALTSPIENLRLAVVDGFAGSGKTTFIKYFITNHDNYNHVYVDCHLHFRAADVDPRVGTLRRQITKAIDILEEKSRLFESAKPSDQDSQLDGMREASAILHELKDGLNPVAAILKSYTGAPIRKDELANALYCMKERIRYLAAYFSKTFIETLSKIKSGELEDRAHEILNSCDFSDTFFLFFVMLFLSLNREKMTIIYIDNLDAVEIDYLSSYFQSGFAAVLASATRLALDSDVFKEPLFFSRRYKFVFCLRDANGAVVNAQIADSLGHVAHPLTFRVGFDAAHYGEIIKLRLDVFKDICIGGSGQLALHSKAAESVVEILETFAADKYFENVFVPLFNLDYRKIMLALFEIGKSFTLKKTGGAIALSEYGRKNQLAVYGLRGTLLGGAIRYLRRDGFLGAFPFIGLERRNPKDGYCLHIRMILTVIVNQSRVASARDLQNPGVKLNAVPFADILRYAYAVYPTREIVDTIVEAFLFHERNWVNLVTIRNRAVINRESLRKFLPEGEADPDRAGSARDAMLEEFRDITVSINPSGFVYLKHILIHFEFYLALVGEYEPLFMIGLRRDGDGKFIFEECIYKVYRLVKRHCVAMNRFFNSKFVGELGYETGRYRRSKFAFKHFGDGRPRNEGLFHSTRIITAHVEYLDKFRLWSLWGLDRDRRRGGSFSEEGNVDPVSVNRMLVKLIERHIRILDESVDDGVRVFQENFAGSIKKIRNSGYRDFRKRISRLSG